MALVALRHLRINKKCKQANYITWLVIKEFREIRAFIPFRNKTMHCLDSSKLSCLIQYSLNSKQFDWLVLFKTHSILICIHPVNSDSYSAGIIQ
jgi:hypothetical protein